MECKATVKPTETLKRKLINIFWSIFTSKFDDNNYYTYHIVCPCHKYSSTPITPCNQ